MKRTNKKGFTLVELVIVIAIIAILAAVLIPTFSGVVKKANESAVLQAARNAYTEYLAKDIADGLLDTKEGTATDPIAMDGVTTTPVVNDAKTDYSTFVYTDSSKNLKATYSATGWSVTATN